MDKILIEDLEKLSRSTYALARGRGGIYGMAKLMPDDPDDEDEIEQPVLHILAAQYNVPMMFKGEWVVFNKDKGQPGCFAHSIDRGDDIKLAVGHDIDCVLADKNTGFTVYETDSAITARSDVRRSRNPLAMLGLVASKKKRCASVQCDIETFEMRNCGGKQVKFITRAKLNEISLVELGLNSPAFAYITDAKQPAPSAKTHSAAFTAKHEAYKAERSAIDGNIASSQWQAISARLDAIEEQLGIPSEAAHKAHIASILRGEHDAQYMRLAVFRR